MRFLILTLAFVGFILLLAGCGSSEPVVSSNAPAWVDKGSSFYEGDRGKAFYGVGAVTGLSDVQMRRTAAETNAARQIAQTFKLHIQDLAKYYGTAVKAGPADGVSQEVMTQQITKAFTDMELSGVTVVDHYYDKDTKTQFALSVLDLEGFKNSLNNVKELNEEVKNRVKFNAEKAFKELDEEIQKQKPQ
jgi:hypothetical protein